VFLHGISCHLQKTIRLRITRYCVLSIGLYGVLGTHARPAPCRTTRARRRDCASSRLVDGRLSPAARRGQELFESERVGCAVCHPAPHYTDLRRHDVGTGGPYDHRSAFDTPTLVDCWPTGQYLHDGRYTSLEELLVEGGHDDQFGGAARLRPEQVRELVEFVLSL